MVRVSTLIGAGASMVLCVASGAYASSGGEGSPDQGFDSTLLGALNVEGADFPVGQPVDFELMGTFYTVTRSPDTPDVLTIISRSRDGEKVDVSTVSVAEVAQTLAHMRKDEEILAQALKNGETLEEAIKDVAEAEGFTPEETEQLEQVAAAAATIGKDEAQVLLDAEKLREDQEKLEADVKFLQLGS